MTRGDNLAIPDESLVYIDTNVLLAHFLIKNDPLKEPSDKFFADIETGRIYATTSTLAVYEAVARIKQKRAGDRVDTDATLCRYFRDTILDGLSEFKMELIEVEDCSPSGGSTMADEAGDHIFSTPAFHSGHGTGKSMKIFDALQAVMAERCGCNYIVSNDSDFARAQFKSIKHVSIKEEYRC